MTFYYGTDLKTATKILNDGFIEMPNLAYSIDVALKCSEQLVKKYPIHRRIRNQRILIIQGLPISALDSAKKITEDLYLLNDEFGKPLKKLHLQNIISIKKQQANVYAKDVKRCLIPMKYE